jgi:hypothetical protein
VPSGEAMAKLRTTEISAGLIVLAKTGKYTQTDTVIPLSGFREVSIVPILIVLVPPKVIYPSAVGPNRIA